MKGGLDERARDKISCLTIVVTSNPYVILAEETDNRKGIGFYEIGFCKSVRITEVTNY